MACPVVPFEKGNTATSFTESTSKLYGYWDESSVINVWRGIMPGVGASGFITTTV